MTISKINKQGYEERYKRGTRSILYFFVQTATIFFCVNSK